MTVLKVRTHKYLARRLIKAVVTDKDKRADWAALDVTKTQFPTKYCDFSF